MKIKDKKAVLVGLGRSSIAAARLLKKHGGCPFISELSNDEKLGPWLEQCEEYDIPLETGGHSPRRFEEADLVIVNPGVPLNAPCLDIPKKNRVPVLGELEFASRFNKSTVFAVTGTNGKTTATSLLHEMVLACGHTSALAGNNDTAWSEVMLREEQPEFCVLEVSSYQLETTDGFHPKVAAVLNITPDHLGRHGDMAGYAAAKARIFRRQEAGDALIVNKEDSYTAAMMPPEGVRRIFFSTNPLEKQGWRSDGTWLYRDEAAVAPCADNPLPGRHNLENVLAMLAVADAGGLDLEGSLSGLRGFKGVEHRIEHVVCLDGVDYFNDSKSTNIDSLRVALESFEQPVVLIAGGRGKGSDYAPLRGLMKGQVHCLVVIGEDGPLLEKAFGDLVPVTYGKSMEHAVREARRLASPGDAVLLSPACASFDMYRNYEERGHDFKKCVMKLESARDGLEEKES